MIPGNEVSKIIDRLNAEKISYWLDKDKVLSGNDFTEKIIDNIEASRIFVYLSSANANSSKWTKREVAYADDLGKYIIPVQIDNAPYNKQVAFHIIDLAFIPYYANPESGLNDLITSIKTYLAKQQAEEQKAKEEQQRIIKEIKIELKTLNNEETKLEADRSTLLAKAERITDPEERDKLKAEIVESSPIYKKLSEERQNLQNKIAELNTHLNYATFDDAIDKWFETPLTPSEMNDLGDDYYYGRNGKTQDYNMAVAWYRKAAEQGNSDGQDNLGWMYRYGYGVEQNFTEAIKWYRMAAEQGNAYGQNHLGVMYKNGYGVEQNYTEAVKWYRKAAEQGNATGQDNLGWMYRKGYGVEQDYTEAVKWYRKAAEQDNDSGQNHLGWMYRHGYGIEKDYTEAVKWYRKAANQGNALGENNLGVMYQNGFGVKKDYTEALKWYRKAAEQGNALGQRNLGEMYENGYGVPKDTETAKEWYKKAAEQGNDYAKERLEKLH